MTGRDDPKEIDGRTELYSVQAALCASPSHGDRVGYQNTMKTVCC